MENIICRPVHTNELDQVHAIFAHYVSNTIASLCCEPPPASVIVGKHKTTSERGLPYLAAVDSNQTEDNASILGYAYALPFRAQSLGYAPSVEISVFIHPSHLHRGIGGRLLTTLLDQLKSAVHHATEPGHEDKASDVPVRNIFAIMAHTAEKPDAIAADGVLAWYQRFGFDVVGRLKNVGCKHGRWVDTVYLQLSLESWNSSERTVPHKAVV